MRGGDVGDGGVCGAGDAGGDGEYVGDGGKVGMSTAGSVPVVITIGFSSVSPLFSSARVLCALPCPCSCSGSACRSCAALWSLGSCAAVLTWVLGAGVVAVTPEVEDSISSCERQQLAAVQL